LFEAGALGAKYSEGRVSCLLVGLKPADVAPPLGQFQNTSNTRDDMSKLIASVNASAKERALPSDRLERAIESYWPRLEKRLKEIEASKEYGDEAQAEPRRDPNSIAAETLVTVRSVHRLLTEAQAQRGRDALAAALYQRLLNNPPALTGDVNALAELMRPLVSDTSGPDAGETGATNLSALLKAKLNKREQEKP
jgi:hypothetical protein